MKWPFMYRKTLCCPGNTDHKWQWETSVCVFWHVLALVKGSFSLKSVCLTLVSWFNSNGRKKHCVLLSTTTAFFFCCKKSTTERDTFSLQEIPECYWIRQDSTSAEKRCHGLGFLVIVSLCCGQKHWLQRGEAFSAMQFLIGKLWKEGCDQQCNEMASGIWRDRKAKKKGSQVSGNSGPE